VCPERELVVFSATAGWSGRREVQALENQGRFNSNRKHRTMATNNEVTLNVSEEQMLAESFKRLEPELAAMSPDEIVPINLDITSAVTTILGVVPRLKVHRDGIRSRLPDFDLDRLDRLEDYARALSYTTLKLAIATEDQ
jgi:hypothetical protein